MELTEQEGRLLLLWEAEHCTGSVSELPACSSYSSPQLQLSFADREAADESVVLWSEAEVSGTRSFHFLQLLTRKHKAGAGADSDQ